MRKYGLIGKTLSHSFSEKFFSEKFLNENISDSEYKNYPLSDLSELIPLLTKQKEIIGLNVTVPFKEKILPFLHFIHPIAAEIEAVNCLRIQRDSANTIQLHGFNTDATAFEQNILSFIGKEKPKALVLGTGGSSKAVQFVLRKLNIEYALVSRTSKNQKVQTYTYEELNEEIIKDHKLIVQCTPIGMFPDVQDFPRLPYAAISNSHFLFDLIYNPVATRFLANGKEQGAKTRNGLEMLHLQAERSWELWK